jgi:hypothetical protein
VRRAPRWGHPGEDRSHLLDDAGLLARSGHDIDIDAEQPRQCRCHRSNSGSPTGSGVGRDLSPGSGVVESEAQHGGAGDPGAAGRRGERDLRPALPATRGGLPRGPERRIVLAEERYGVAWPWPSRGAPGHRSRAAVSHRDPTRAGQLGKSTATAAPRLCREANAFAALRLRDATSDRRSVTWR